MQLSFLFIHGVQNVAKITWLSDYWDFAGWNSAVTNLSLP